MPACSPERFLREHCVLPAGRYSALAYVKIHPLLTLIVIITAFAGAPMTTSPAFQPINMDRSQRTVIVAGEQTWLPAPQAPVERIPLERRSEERRVGKECRTREAP